MKYLLWLMLLVGCGPLLWAQSRTTPQDGDWAKKIEVKKNTPQADLMIRVGDIDHLNFGFPEDFTPFKGRPTDVHGYPWEADPADPAGTDRIKAVGYGPERPLVPNDSPVNRAKNRRVELRITRI